MSRLDVGSTLQAYGLARWAHSQGELWALHDSYAKGALRPGDIVFYSHENPEDDTSGKYWGNVYHVGILSHRDANGAWWTIHATGVGTPTGVMREKIAPQLLAEMSFAWRPKWTLRPGMYPSGTWVGTPRGNCQAVPGTPALRASLIEGKGVLRIRLRPPANGKWPSGAIAAFDEPSGARIPRPAANIQVQVSNPDGSTGLVTLWGGGTAVTTKDVKVTELDLEVVSDVEWSPHNGT